MTEEYEVTSGQVAAYDNDGVVLLKNAIDDKWQDLLRTAIENELLRKENFFLDNHPLPLLYQN